MRLTVNTTKNIDSIELFTLHTPLFTSTGREFIYLRVNGQPWYQWPLANSTRYGTVRYGTEWYVDVVRY